MNYGAKIRNIPYINRNRAEKVAMFNEKPSEKSRKNGRWPKGKANRVPRVKVLNYLKKVALFFRFERDIPALSLQRRRAGW